MMHRSGPLSAAAIVLAAVSATAAATDIHISGSVVCQFGACNGTPEHDYGEVSIDLQATGLPIPYNQENNTAPVTNVSALLTLNDGTRFVGTGGSGDVESSSLGYNRLRFEAGDFLAYLVVPVDWTGSGVLPDNDGDSSSRLSFGTADYYFSGDSSVVTTVTPEPESISLILLGLGSTGCAWVGMGRRRLLGR